MGMSKDKVVHEFIPAEEFEEDKAEDELRTVEYVDPEPYSETAMASRELQPLEEMAESGDGVTRLSLPREVKRKKVVNAFHEAFELIGGVPRLAHWADQSPSAFYKLYARLLPTQANQQLEHSGEIRVRHILPRGPLDEE
jgi:hypothetical protein